MYSRPLSAIAREKTPVIVEPGLSVTDAAAAMKAQGEGVALVVEGGRAVGILTRGDIVERVVAEGKDPGKTSVAQAMTENPVVIREHCSVGHALYLMHEYGVHYVPVIGESGPVCVIHIADATAVDLSEYAHDVEMLDQIAELI